MDKSKRKAIEERILLAITLLDKGGLNVQAQKKFLTEKTDKEFESWLKKFLNDPSENFYLEFLPGDDEPDLPTIVKAGKVLNIPLEEYVFYKHLGSDGTPVRSRERVMVGYLYLKKLQQIITKKNSYTLSTDKRSQKTGQVTGEDKAARVTDQETPALLVLGGDYALKEFMGPRADNMEKKNKMSEDIANYGFVSMDDLEGSINNSQTINTL